MEKLKDWLRDYLKKWPADALMAGLWLTLETAACMGFAPVLFYPLYYVTGALAGLTGGSILGGILGRGLILVFLRESIWMLCFSRVPMQQRWDYLKERLKNMLSGLIPYVKDIRGLLTRDIYMLAAEGFGLVLALLFSLFFSGDGSPVNSFVNLALFVYCTSVLQTHSGLLFEGWNALRRRAKLPDAGTNYFEGFLSAHAFGYILGSLLYAILPDNFWVCLIAWIN